MSCVKHTSPYPPDKSGQALQRGTPSEMPTHFPLAKRGACPPLEVKAAVFTHICRSKAKRGVCPPLESLSRFVGRVGGGKVALGFGQKFSLTCIKPKQIASHLVSNQPG